MGAGEEGEEARRATAGKKEEGGGSWGRGVTYGVAGDEVRGEEKERLEKLQADLEDESRGPPARDRARQQADEILIEMRKVLDRMIELEDFNEAMELLRAIIKLQDDLREQTRERQKQKIRELLQED